MTRFLATDLAPSCGLGFPQNKVPKPKTTVSYGVGYDRGYLLEFGVFMGVFEGVFEGVLER